MAKTRRVKTKRFYGGNGEHGPDTEKLMRSIERIRNGYLDLTGLNITSLPPLPPTVTHIEFSSTSNTSLPELPPTLRRLDVINMQITSLPALPPTLEMLYISNVPMITSLPALPPTLEILHVEDAKMITSLPALPPNLKKLKLYYTGVTSLPALPSRLDELEVRVTPITRLPALPNTLTVLNVAATRITSLPLLPPKLRILDVSGTNLTSLPLLPDTIMSLNVLGTSIPPKNNRERISQYNARVKARDLSAAQQTVFRPGSTSSPALQRLMDTNILKTEITPMLTGKSGQESNVLPASKPTAMQTLKKEATGRYGGRTKKNKRA